MPTHLPRPPLPRPGRAEQKRSLFSLVLNGSMLVSALVLTFIVLQRQQQYAMGQRGPFADTIVQLTQQFSTDRDAPPAN